MVIGSSNLLILSKQECDSPSSPKLENEPLVKFKSGECSQIHACKDRPGVLLCFNFEVPSNLPD